MVPANYLKDVNKATIVYHRWKVKSILNVAGHFGDLLVIEIQIVVHQTFLLKA